MCFLKTTILDAELVNVPIVNENGTTDVGKSKFKMGIRIRLAPPPQIALIQRRVLFRETIGLFLLSSFKEITSYMCYYECKTVI